MVKNKKPNVIFEEIGSVRNQITNETDSLNYDVIQPSRDGISRLITYIENQVDNLKDYAESMKKLCKDDICASILEIQIKELIEIKSSLCRRLDHGIYPIEEPSLEPLEFFIHYLKISAPILGDLLTRLNRTLIFLDQMHETMIKN